jgi:hypothetical protein
MQVSDLMYTYMMLCQGYERKACSRCKSHFDELHLDPSGLGSLDKLRVCVLSTQVFQKNKAEQCKDRPDDSLTFVNVRSVAVIAMKGQDSTAAHLVKLANLEQHAAH